METLRTSNRYAHREDLQDALVARYAQNNRAAKAIYLHQIGFDLPGRRLVLVICRSGFQVEKH